MKRQKESPEHYLSRATSRALTVCQAKARTEGREATMEEISAALNAVPSKPPKRKKSHGRDGKWYHFHFLTFIQLDQWKVKYFSKKEFDPLSYATDFRYDQSAIDIEGIVQSIPENDSREEIMATLREAIEDKLRAIALIESVLAEVTKWDWEEVKEFGPDYYKTDGKIKKGPP
jgi:hypothetical protein